MNFLRQSTALLRLNLGGLAARSGAVLTILIGVTCAVGGWASTLAMGTGAHRQALGDVRDDVAVVVSRGSSDLDSSAPREQATTVADLPGMSLGSDGKPLIGYQSVVIMEGHRRGTGARVFFVRRAKARSFSGCESHPATFAPAGSNRSSRGGNEAAE